MNILRQLWKNRGLLMEVLEGVRKAVAAGGTIAEIRRRLADGIQRGDIVSDDALSKFKAANEKAERFIRTGK
jgi:hypothetical protein